MEISTQELLALGADEEIMSIFKNGELVYPFSNYQPTIDRNENESAKDYLERLKEDVRTFNNKRKYEAHKQWLKMNNITPIKPDKQSEIDEYYKEAMTCDISKNLTLQEWYDKNGYTRKSRGENS